MTIDHGDPGDPTHCRSGVGVGVAAHLFTRQVVANRTGALALEQLSLSGGEFGLCRCGHDYRADEAHKDPDDLLVCGPLRLDSSRYEATLDGTPLRLTLAEYRLLRALASHPGRVFTRESLVARTTGGHHIVERNIDVHIASIRRQLGSAAKMIETVRGVGYKLRD